MYGEWGLAMAIIVLGSLVDLAALPGEPASDGPSPLDHLVVPVSSAVDVTVFEGTSGVTERTYSVPTLMGAGGTLHTAANEDYTFTSDGTNLIIDCVRITAQSDVGNNIVAARLNGVPGFAEVWAGVVVNFTVGTLGDPNSRFLALGPDLTDATWTHGSTDGQIFTVIANGGGAKSTMVGFKGKMPDQDLWNIINYLRSLAPKAAAR